MTFPVPARTRGKTDAEGTDHVVSLPTVVDGDKLVVFFADDGGDVITFPAGWDERFDMRSADSGSGHTRGVVYSRDCDGTEGSSITVTTEGSEKTLWTVFHFTASEVHDSTPWIEVSTGVRSDGTASSTPDPDNLAPSWGSADNWFAALMSMDSDRIVTGFPSNTTDQYEDTVTSGGAVTYGIAERYETALSAWDPSNFTVDGSDQYVALTIAVRPAAAGGGPHIGTADLVGIGALSADGALVLGGSVALEGVGSVVASGGVLLRGSAALEGVGSVVASGGVLLRGSAGLEGVGSVVATGTLAGVSAALEGVGSVVASGGVLVGGSVALEGIGSVVATGTLAPIGGVGSFVGVGALVATGTLAGASAALEGVGSVVASGGVLLSGSAAFEGVGSVVASGGVLLRGSSSVVGVGSVVATGTLVPIGGVGNLVGVGDLVAIGTVATTDLFCDDFNRVDAATLGPDWDQWTAGAIELAIVTNRVEGGDNNHQRATVAASAGVGSMGDADVTIKIAYNAQIERRWMALLRDNGVAFGSGSEGYVFGISNRTADGLTLNVPTIGKLTDSTISIIGSAATFTFDDLSDYWIRAQAQGSDLRLRIWKDGDAEPGTWTLTASDTDLTAGGVGFYTKGGSNRRTYFDDFCVNTLAVVGTAVLEGVGSLVANGTTVVSGGSSLAGVGTIVASGILAPIGGVGNLVGTGTFAAAGGVVTGGFATLEGLGAVVASGTIPSVGGTANLTGVGSTTASGTLAAISGVANLEGFGELIATATGGIGGTANLTGIGTTTSSGQAIIVSGGSLEGLGIVAANGTALYGGGASLVGSGETTAQGTLIILGGVASLLGIGTLQASVAGLVNGDADLRGLGALAADGRIVAPGLVALLGVGDLSAAGATIILSDSGNLEGLGLVVVFGDVLSPGGANLVGLGALTGAARRIYGGGAPLAGVGVLTGDSGLIVPGVAPLVGVGALFGVPQTGVNGIGSLVGLGVVTPDGSIVYRSLTGELLGVGHLRIRQAPIIFVPSAPAAAPAVGVVVLVDRVPVQSGAPTFIERGPLLGASNVTLEERLNEAGSLTFTIGPKEQEAAIQQRLRNLDQYPSEVWLYVDGALVFSGPLVGYSVSADAQSTSFAVTAQGLYSYVSRWWVEPSDQDLDYVDLDQTLIAKALLDLWQGKDYGDFGIDTSSVVPSGVLRDRTYLAKDIHNIAARIDELRAVHNGFDLWVDPPTRQFSTAYPARGQDLSQTVIIDGRSVVSPSASITVGPGDYVSEAYVWSPSGEGEGSITSHQTDSGIRQTWGRIGIAQSHQNLALQATADDKASLILNERSSQFHVPTATIYPIGLEWEDFNPGDLVGFEYDYGAGKLIETRRIRSKRLVLGNDGGEEIGVEFV